MKNTDYRDTNATVFRWIFAAPVFRYRWVRLPLAALFIFMAVYGVVHGVTSVDAGEMGGRSAIAPVFLLLPAIYLLVLPLTPLADGWNEADGRG